MSDLDDFFASDKETAAATKIYATPPTEVSRTRSSSLATNSEAAAAEEEQQSAEENDERDEEGNKRDQSGNSSRSRSYSSGSSTASTPRKLRREGASCSDADSSMTSSNAKEKQKNALSGDESRGRQGRSETTRRRDNPPAPNASKLSPSSRSDQQTRDRKQKTSSTPRSGESTGGKSGQSNGNGGRSGDEGRSRSVGGASGSEAGRDKSRQQNEPTSSSGKYANDPWDYDVRPGASLVTAYDRLEPKFEPRFSHYKYNTFEGIKWDHASYTEHRRRITVAKPLVDTKPPSNFTHVQCNLRKLKLAQDRQDAIERDNRLLLDRLVKAMTTTRIDNWNDLDRRAAPSSRSKQRNLIIQMAAENKKLQQRLDNRKSAVSRSDCYSRRADASSAHSSRGHHRRYMEKHRNEQERERQQQQPQQQDDESRSAKYRGQERRKKSATTN